MFLTKAIVKSQGRQTPVTLSYRCYEDVLSLESRSRSTCYFPWYKN